MRGVAQQTPGEAGVSIWQLSVPRQRSRLIKLQYTRPHYGRCVGYNFFFLVTVNDGCAKWLLDCR
jgi:hypothetical protein